VDPIRTGAATPAAVVALRSAWTVGRLLRDVAGIAPETSCRAVFERFELEPEAVVIPVVRDGATVGLVARADFLYRLATPFGRSLYARRPITALMDADPLVVEADAALADVSRRVAARPRALQSGFVLSRGGVYAGVAHGTDFVQAVADAADDASARVLRSGEEQRRLLDALPAPLVVVGAGDASIRRLNEWAADLFGIAPEDARGRPAAALFADPGWLSALAERVRVEQSVDEVETRLVTAAGGGVWALASARPLVYEDEAVLVVMLMPIEERKQMEQALRESGERLALAVSATRSGLWDADFRSGRFYWSPEFYELLGLGLDEFRPDPRAFGGLIHPDDREEVEARIRASLEGTEDAYAAVYRLMRADGSWIWVDARGRVVRDDEGRAARFTGIMLDVTAQRAGEEALQAAKTAAEAAYAELRAAQESLVQSEKLAALGGLVAGVAHEINTPVGVALTSASLLHERAAEFAGLVAGGRIRRADLDAFLAVSSETARLIESNLRRAAELVQSFKRVAVDQSSGDRRRFDLHDYLHEVVTSLSPRLRGTRHRIEVECPKPLPVDTFPGALAQVVTNFVVNAQVHAFPEGRPGLMRLEARRSGDDEVEIRFADDGVGIPPTNLQRIFEPFFTTRRGRGGTGLGLHIVFNLVTAQLAGTLRVDSTPGEGTVFTVRMPAVAPRRARTGAAAAPDEAAPDDAAPETATRDAAAGDAAARDGAGGGEAAAG